VLRPPRRERLRLLAHRPRAPQQVAASLPRAPQARERGARATRRPASPPGPLAPDRQPARPRRTPRLRDPGPSLRIRVPARSALPAIDDTYVLEAWSKLPSSSTPCPRPQEVASLGATGRYKGDGDDKRPAASGRSHNWLPVGHASDRLPPTDQRLPKLRVFGAPHVKCRALPLPSVITPPHAGGNPCSGGFIPEDEWFLREASTHAVRCWLDASSRPWRDRARKRGRAPDPYARRARSPSPRAHAAGAAPDRGRCPSV
jgi:hypothetical protein